MPVKKSYWLMKSDPDVYDIDDLKKERTCYWDGVKGPSGTRYPTHRKRRARGGKLTWTTMWYSPETFVDPEGFLAAVERLEKLYLEQVAAEGR